MPGLSVPTDWLLTKARFQRNYLWDVLLPDIGMKAGGLIGFGLAQLVQTVEFGDYSIPNPIKMKYGPYEASFAGLLSVNRVGMTFLKTMPDAVAAYFSAWKKLIVDDQGLYHPKANYQKNIYIRFLDSTSVAIGRYKLIGCFPTSFPSYSLNYKDNEVTTVKVEFSIDKLEYEWF